MFSKNKNSIIKKGFAMLSLGAVLASFVSQTTFAIKNGEFACTGDKNSRRAFSITELKEKIEKAQLEFDEVSRKAVEAKRNLGEAQNKLEEAMSKVTEAANKAKEAAIKSEEAMNKQSRL